MKKTILLFSMLLAVVASGAQSFKEAIKANPHVAASNLYAYPEPTEALTPTPVGYTPYYLSHYGRHGSRYLIDPKQYSRPIEYLHRADSLGFLSDSGQAVLRTVKLMAAEADGRYGELTRLGAKQHQGIARRMIDHFPQIFSGETTIQARSTNVIRCILSMTNEIQEFVRINPRLTIDCDASEHDMYYMNYNDPAVEKLRKARILKKTYDNWVKVHINNQSLMRRLFNNELYARTLGDSYQFADDIFTLASEEQNTNLSDYNEFYDMFSTEELYREWQKNNIWWYLNYGPSKLTNSKVPLSQVNLVEDIVEKADSCLKLQHPGATLRFGHDSVILPLVCLLNINGYNLRTADVDSLDTKGWIATKVFPMAANLQFVFYKPTKNNPNGQIIMKVLLNEEEATLPLKPVEGLRYANNAKPTRNPYYLWADVRNYLEDIISRKQ